MDIYIILEIIFNFFFSFILAPLILGYKQRKKLNKADKIGYYFLLAVLSLEIIENIFRFNAIRNHFMHYFSTFASISLGGWYFQKTLPSLKKTIQIIIALMFVSIITEGFIIGFNQVNSNTEALTYLLLTVFSFMSLRAIFSAKNQDIIGSNSTFWLSLGFFIYSFFSIFTSFFKRQFIETSIELYFFFDMLSVIARATAFVTIAIGYWTKTVEDK